MNDLIEVFRTKANHLEKELSYTIDSVHNGFAPTPEYIAHVDDLLSEVRSGYEEIKAKEICADIADELSIEEYYTHYEAEQALLRTTQLEKAREMLRMFIEVKATQIDFANAIQRQKDEAQSKLNRVSEDIPDTTAEGLFFHALSLDLIPEALNEKLDEFFVGKVTRDLASKVYYLPDGVIEKTPNQVKKPTLLKTCPLLSRKKFLHRLCFLN